MPAQSLRPLRVLLIDDHMMVAEMLAAQDLVISTGTVRTHIRNIFAKLDVHSSPEAVRVAWAAGLNMQESPG